VTQSSIISYFHYNIKEFQYQTSEMPSTTAFRRIHWLRSAEKAV